MSKMNFLNFNIFNLKYLLIEFIILNLSQIYFCIPYLFKTNVWNRIKPPFEFCLLVLWIHKGYFVVKGCVLLLLNIKSFKIILNNFFIPESFNTNISHQLFTSRLPLWFHNTRKQIQKVILYLKPGFKRLFERFLV